jgi:hypothetical protein
LKTNGEEAGRGLKVLAVLKNGPAEETMLKNLTRFVRAARMNSICGAGERNVGGKRRPIFINTRLQPGVRCQPTFLTASAVYSVPETAEAVSSVEAFETPG